MEHNNPQSAERGFILSFITHEPISLEQLATAARKIDESLTQEQIKSIVLKLISGRQITLTSDRKLVLKGIRTD